MGYDIRNAQLFARFGSASGAGVTNAYDAFGRLASSSSNMSGTARTLSYQHDAAGRRTRLTFPDGAFFAYEHDAAGNLTAVRENGGTVVASFSYNSAGRVLGQSVSGAATAYGYDTIFRLQSLGHDLAGTGADQTLTFAYNPASQIVTRTAANDAYASNTAYNVSRAYAVNGLNQYTTAGPAAFAYDANGNLTSDGSTTMIYDAENRLVSASGASTAALSYDPLGRLFQTSGGAPGTTQFLWDGDELVAEYNASGTLLRRYVHGLGTDDPILWYEGAGLADRRSLMADHQGSIIAVANSSGSSIAINAYDAWGIPNGASGTGTPNVGRFQYTGQIFLPEFGMYHYKARIYSPTLGRFLQTDPVGYEDQVNLYAYVGNDPFNNTDPTGMNACPEEEDTICVEASKQGHKQESSPSPMPKPDLGTISVPGIGERRSENTEPSTTEQAWQCVLDQLGLDELAAASAVAAGQPIPGTKRFVTPGSSRGTSVAGLAANRIFGKAQLPTALPSVVGGPGTGRSLAIVSTKSAARFAGRAVPIVGWALLAYDAASIANCTLNGD